jgi:hypothetical protein
MGALAAVIACLVAYPGCGAEARPVPVVPTEKVALTYERSGGLAATPQKLVIRPGRQAAATGTNAAGKKKTVHFRLSAPKTNQLRNKLLDRRFALLEDSVAPGNCADCYLYSIKFRGHSVSISQVDVPAWLAKTIGHLEALAAHRPLH